MAARYVVLELLTPDDDIQDAADLAGFIGNELDNANVHARVWTVPAEPLTWEEAL